MFVKRLRDDCCSICPVTERSCVASTLKKRIPKKERLFLAFYTDPRPQPATSRPACRKPGKETPRCLAGGSSVAAAVVDCELEKKKKKKKTRTNWSAELKGRFFSSPVAGVRTSTEIVTRHFIDVERGVPLKVHARPRIVGRRPDAIVNIETDVFQEKSYKQYSSQHLRDALIAVKKGYSVYAASNKYGVPRKTLRNWMEKYDIKSQFSKGRRGARSQMLDPLDLMREARSERSIQITETLRSNTIPADFAIANVQCQYDSASDNDTETERPAARPPDDHTYDLRDEPPAFIIHQVNNTPQLQSSAPYVEVRPKIMTIGPGYTPGVNVIHVGDRPQIGPNTERLMVTTPMVSQTTPPAEYSINKRIRRSEVVLRQAADCVSRGLTFQTVSEQFNIPISTIRFFMARKGILPQRRRGRSAQLNRTCSSPEPPFHMQHFKLPDMMTLRPEEGDTSSQPDVKLQ
ncbi:unnamed protein product, partial [Iphiclides podalirius]